MTTERQACGLGSFLPMSCRGRAEAFARRLHNRLQSLGRAGSGDGATLAADETSWLANHSDVTNHQPRLSSSTESDIYFDFDLDYESPGSPVDETTCTENVPDFLVNKSRSYHRTPKTQYSSEARCALSSSTVTGTSPDSDSSDGLYFDPENSDTENYHNHNHEPSPETDAASVEKLNVSNHINGSHFEKGTYSKMNGCVLDSKQDANNHEETCRRIAKRNFRNAAGFRVNNEERNSPDKTPIAVVASPINPTMVSDRGKVGSFSRDSSLADEYFECVSPKLETSVIEDVKSISLYDSGFPNTAESSRCNSQNESVFTPTETTEANNDFSLGSDHNLIESNVPNESSEIVYQRSNECVPDSEENSKISLIQNIGDSETKHVLDNSENGVSTLVDPPSFETTLPSSNGTSTDFSDTVFQNENNCSSESLKESVSTSTLCRPSDLVIQCPIILFNNNVTDTKENGDLKLPERKLPSDDDDDDANRSPQRVRRCSSLKTGKTPPGTPGRKKIVRFADVLGLDLADIRTFLDEIPKVPLSAYEDLQCAEISSDTAPVFTEGTLTEAISSGCIGSVSKSDRCLIPLFQQPSGQLGFMDRVREELVCLENALLSDAVSCSISGTVRVRNLDFHKSVHIRYSLDGWKTFADLQATYVPNSCDGFSDKFTFVLYAHTVQIGQRLEFAVRFQCRGSQYWDSNHGTNYVFQCLPPAGYTQYKPISISPVDDISTSFY